MVVLDDAEAAKSAVWGATLLAGQTCISVERVYVSRRVASEFIAAAEEAIHQLTIGSDDSRDGDVVVVEHDGPHAVAVLLRQRGELLAPV